jgi:DNA-binding MarR family transcriptional regulator
MTSNLDSLERNGFISRAIHKGDRRMIAVTLTEKGVDYCTQFLPYRYRDISRIMEILSDHERQVLDNAYKKIIEFLKEVLKEDQIDFTKTTPARA